VTECAAVRRFAEIAKNWAKSTPEIAQVYLFGSQIMGTATPESDLDIAISLKYEESENSLSYWMQYQELWTVELWALLRIKVDLQCYCGSESPTIHAALNKASHLVYCNATHFMSARLTPNK